MQNEIIDAVLARGIHAGTRRRQAVVAWVVMIGQLDYPGKVVAHRYNATSTSFVLLANTLAEIHAVLPLGFVRSDRQQADPPEIMEIWLPA